MDNFVDVDQVTGTYLLRGCFDKFTIPKQWQEIAPLFNKTKPIVIDLSAIIECDSALIALLVEVKRKYPEISIVNVPENLTLLLDLYQVKQLLF